MLDWDSLDPGKFERVAQMLLREEFGATSIDGSGGDGAQDLRWDSPEGLVLFEVKSFRKQLTSGQRRQVQRSLFRAVELHAPIRWILVTRSNPGPTGFSWLQSNAPRVPGVRLEWLGRDWLDLKIAGREELISYVEGSEYKLLQRATEFKMEREALATGTDLSERVRLLLSRGNDISPYWRWQFTETDRGLMRTLVAKRPESSIEDPVSISPRFTFPADDPEAHKVSQQLNKTLRVGGAVSIPSRFVEDFTVTAASDATRRLIGDEDRAGGAVEIMSVPDMTGLPLNASLVLQPSGDRETCSVAVSFTRRLTGTHGQTLLGEDMNNVMDLELVVDQASDLASSLNITLKPVAGRYPHELAPVLRMLTSWAPGDTLELCVGPMRLASLTSDRSWPQDLGPLARLTASLEVIQSHLQTVIPIPHEDIPPEDWRNIIRIAQALSGQRANLPYSGLNVGLRPGAVDEFLRKIPVAGGALYIRHGASIELDGQPYEIQGLATFAPKTTVANRRELSDGRRRVEEPTARFEPMEDEGFYLVRAVDDPPAPWATLGEVASQGTRPIL